MTLPATCGGDGRLPIVNTHIHFPPNFSAFVTPADAVQQAVAQRVRAVGISNFYDQQVYRIFAELAVQADIVALFGLEFITLIDELAAQGIRINDPANPGRMYLCGKGINPFKQKSAQATATAAAIRDGNDQRAATMIAQLTEHFAQHGLETALTAQTVAAAVAQRAGVDPAWVSLQERHVAMAYQQALAALPADRRARVLERVYGCPSSVNIDDSVALQAEIRSRLIKVGTPGFVPEVPLSFADAYQYVLEMDGIPVYPTLADGVRPLCPFEQDPAALASELLSRGIYAAELIPIRNTVAVTDAYVRAFTDAGIVVMAGTEHNTLDRIPIDPACVDGAMSQMARQAFWEGTCMVAAHQHCLAQGKPGLVDSTGARCGDSAHRAELVALGSQLIS